MADAGPLVLNWRGQQIRVRHDDPRLGVYTPGGAVIRNAICLASDVRGLELALNATVGDRYTVRVGSDRKGSRVAQRLPVIC